MANNDDDEGGCCCAIVVVGIIAMIIGGLLNFIRSQPVWTVGIGLVVVALVVLLIVGYRSGEEGEVKRRPRHVRPREIASKAEHERPLPAAGATNSGNRSTIFPQSRLSSYQDNGGSVAAFETMRADESGGDGILPTASEATCSPNKEASIGQHESLMPEANASSALNDEVLSTTEMGNSSLSASSAGEVQAWTPLELQGLVKELLVHDGWAILRAGVDSERGGLDIIAGRGRTKVAVQCHASAAGKVLSDYELQKLMSAPFAVHDIAEAAIVAPTGASPAARDAIATSDATVHFIDAERLQTWRDRAARLEPRWGLVALEK